MNLGIRNGGDFLNHSIAEEGMGLVDVSSLPSHTLKAASRASHSGSWICILSLQLQNQQSDPLSFTPIRNLCECIITHPFSVESTPITEWLQNPALSPLLGEGTADTKLPPDPPLFLCKRSAEIFFYLSFLAGAFQHGNASYILTSRRSVYLWISYPPLAWWYPSLLIFWAGCVAHLFAQAPAWGRGDEHV